MPYCPECGADTGNNDYCHECGFPIAEYQQKLQSETISPNYSDDTRIENPRPTIPVNQTPPAFAPAPKNQGRLHDSALQSTPFAKQMLPLKKGSRAKRPNPFHFPFVKTKRP